MFVFLLFPIKMGCTQNHTKENREHQNLLRLFWINFEKKTDNSNCKLQSNIMYPKNRKIEIQKTKRYCGSLRTEILFEDNLNLLWTEVEMNSQTRCLPNLLIAVFNWYNKNVLPTKHEDTFPKSKIYVAQESVYSDNLHSIFMKVFMWL